MNDDRAEDEMARRMYAQNEKLMRTAGAGRPADGYEGRLRPPAPGPSQTPAWGVTGRHRYPPRGEPVGRGRPDRGYNDGYRLVDHVGQLAEDTVRGIGELAYRLADLASMAPAQLAGPGYRALPQLPFWPYPSYHGGGSPESPSVLDLGAAARGGSVQGGLDLENTTNCTFDGLRLRCSALVSEHGVSIPGNQVSIAPTTITLRPWGSVRVSVRVAVPSGTAAGRYVGMVEADGDGMRCLLAVTVS